MEYAAVSETQCNQKIAQAADQRRLLGFARDRYEGMRKELLKLHNQARFRYYKRMAFCTTVDIYRQSDKKAIFQHCMY